MRRPAAVEVLAAIDRVLRKARRRWYVFGAQAVLAYGEPRLTADVDVLVDAAGAPAAALLGDFARAGIALRFASSSKHLRAARLLPLVHAATATPVDVVLASSDLQREFLARARRIDLGGVKVPVVSPEDLVVQKVIAGRRKDLEDVRGILARQRSRLDVARARELVAEIAAATNDPRLTRRLERLLAASPR
ncbi:MAG TPA: nucleotidyltransferase [Minicystis sp.]|nr:nucleotidyltransferase [Minicystis sp.]